MAKFNVWSECITTSRRAFGKLCQRLQVGDSFRPQWVDIHNEATTRRV